MLFKLPNFTVKISERFTSINLRSIPSDHGEATGNAQAIHVNGVSIGWGRWQLRKQLLQERKRGVYEGVLNERSCRHTV